MKALRLSRIDPDRAFANLLSYTEFLGLIFIIQIIVAIWSATYFEGVITPWVASLYILLWVGMLVVFGLKAKQIDTPTDPSSVAPRGWVSKTFRYTLFFIVGLAIFGTIEHSGIIVGGTVFPTHAWAIFVFHVVIVAPAETIAFQGILPNRARAWVRKQDSHLIKKYENFMVYGPTQFLFAIGHYATYGGKGALLLTAFIFGCLFLYIAEKWGLTSAMGIHSSWNLVIIGCVGGISIQTMMHPGFIGVLSLIIITMTMFGVLAWAVMSGKSFRVFDFRRRANRSVV